MAVLMAAAMLGSGLRVAAMEFSGRKADLQMKEELKESICKEIMEVQKSYYDGVYTFEKWEFEFENEEVSGAVYETDVNVYADMILISSYEESPYYQGLMAVCDDVSGQSVTEMAAIGNVADAYKNLVEGYYLKPYRTDFRYHAEITYAGENISIQLYRGVNQGLEYSWEKIKKNDKFEDLAAYEDGMEAARQIIKRQKQSAISRAASISGYKAGNAVEYAVFHATDEPEFNENNGGSDCANFVSKCINAGGIPTDKTGKWYPATEWGNLHTAGDNWKRTGHYADQGGITIYFSNKGYISEVPSSAVGTGCLMSWNNKSHIAMVTYCDGRTIKYSDHSDTKKDSAYHTYTTEDVKFYQFN
ncbi:MAG: amidase domain-containing protein [Lachnoclostridium sp.]|nr:amidase domain-containing protein [Lachnospira sp.]MCM1248038.1 amidase domain-containing protein [Lachnoclostridium sp.]MCM1535855.1 amidase domain-containing protein [Clostridium sp.]